MTARYLVRKVATLLLTLFVVLTFNFLLFHVLPGNPAKLLARSGHLDPQAEKQLTALFGLNHSVPVQYIDYLRAMFHGNLGFSYIYREPVSQVLGPAVWNTALLLGVATFVTVVLGVAVGVFAGARSHSRRDTGVVTTSLVLWSLPTFWTGMILIIIMGVWLHAFPISGLSTPGNIYTELGHLEDVGLHLFLPALTLVLVNVAEFVLISRSALVDVMSEDYMVTARAKGLKRGVIIWRHGFRNAMLPIVTATALYIGMVLGGAIEVETVFSWPGMGLLTYNSVLQRDYPVLEAAFLVFTVGVILANFIADLMYHALDPRVRNA